MSQFCLSGFCDFTILVMIYLDAPCCDPQKSEMELADSISSLQLFDLQINGPRYVVLGRLSSAPELHPSGL
jgi:hypothetical protein